MKFIRFFIYAFVGDVDVDIEEENKQIIDTKVERIEITKEEYYDEDSPIQNYGGISWNNLLKIFKK